MMFEQRVSELGLQLPPEPLLPKCVRVPFDWVRVVPLEAAQESARLTVLAMLGALRLALGSLDRVRDWVSLSGFVNADPGYTQTTAVLNPASDLPLNLPVIMSAEVIVTP
jgi:hypothetical protein